MDKKSSSVSGGIGVVGLLGVAFIILKLCNVIQWSWLWVLSPFWIELIIVVIALVIILIAYIVKEHKEKKRFEEYLDKHERK